jgi:hypothetical protein
MSWPKARTLRGSILSGNRVESLRLGGLYDRGFNLDLSVPPRPCV